MKLTEIGKNEALYMKKIKIESILNTKLDCPQSSLCCK